MTKLDHMRSDQNIKLFKERWRELLHSETPLSIRAQPSTKQSYIFYLKNSSRNWGKIELNLDKLELSSKGKVKPWMKEIVDYASDLPDFNIVAFDPHCCCDYDVVLLAENIVRSSIEEGFHAQYLSNLISLPELISPPINEDEEMLFEIFINRLLIKLQERKIPRIIDVYAQIKGGSRKRGKKYKWHELPDSITVMFQETNDIHNYCKNAQSLRFLKYSVKAQDPYSAVHKAYEEYQLMFNNMNITKKRKSSGKNVHYRGKNEGGSPVIVDDSMLVDDPLTLEEFSIPLFHRVLEKPPYQVLKTNIDGIRDYFEFFGKECQVFRTLADCYSRAVWCIKDNDIEGIFQNLAEDFRFLVMFMLLNIS